MLVDDLIKAESGIESVTPDNEPIIIRARCISSSCDLPAKASLFCQIQHGGKCACNYCNNQGMKIGTMFCYPLIKEYEKEKINHSMRTENEIREIYNVFDSISTNGNLMERFPVQKGIYDKSVFSKLPYWQWTQFGTIDFMHLFMGIFSMLMNLWSKPKVCKAKFYLSMN